VRSEGGAECARLQEANGNGNGAGGYVSTTSPTLSQSPPRPQRARTRGGGGGGRGEQDSVVFKRDQGQEVQWGLGVGWWVGLVFEWGNDDDVMTLTALPRLTPHKTRPPSLDKSLQQDKT
jgi:hypothetical protein